MSNSGKQAGDTVELPGEPVTIGGLNYRLTHPGVREWFKIRTKFLNVQTQQFAMDELMDYFFENCVVPDGQSKKPTLDTISLVEGEEWGIIAPRFLRSGKVSAPGK